MSEFPIRVIMKLQKAAFCKRMAYPLTHWNFGLDFLQNPIA
jgi:hypothetical protein